MSELDTRLEAVADLSYSNIGDYAHAIFTAVLALR